MLDFNLPAAGMQRGLNTIQEASEGMLQATEPQSMPIFQDKPGSLSTLARDTFTSRPTLTTPSATGDPFISNIVKLNEGKLQFDVAAALFKSFRNLFEQMLDLLSKPIKAELISKASSRIILAMRV